MMQVVRNVMVRKLRYVVMAHWIQPVGPIPASDVLTRMVQLVPVPPVTAGINFQRLRHVSHRHASTVTQDLILLINQYMKAPGTA